MSVVETRYGPMRIIDSDVVISRSLSLYGEWAQLEIDILARFIPQGGVVVDAGAFIGTHARAFSTIVGSTGRVLAFEPRSVIAAILEENARLASLSNIEVRACALGSVQETVSLAAMNLAEEMNFGASAFHTKSIPIVGEDAVGIALDQLELDRVDLIKADVEGMEFDVLQGAGRTLERLRPVVFAETNRISDSLALLDWARNRHYRTLGVLTQAFNPTNHASNRDNCFGESAEAGLLFVPAERWVSYEATANALRLPVLETADDLSCLLLHKPQYPYEVLANTAIGASLGLQYPSPLATDLRAQVTELARALHEKDALLDERTQAIAKSDEAEVADLHEELHKQRAVLDLREEELRWQEQSIDELTAMLASRNEQFQALNRSLIEREATLLKRELALMTSARLIHGRDQLLIQRDSELRRLRQTLLERDATAIYLDQQFRILKQALTARDHTILELKQRVAESESQLSAQSDHIAMIVQSRSWRLTKPLRLISAMSRQEWRTEEKHQSNGGRHEDTGENAAIVLGLPVEVADENLKGTVNGDHSRSVAARPSLDVESLADELRTDFDEDYYRRQNPEVAEAGVDLLRHFLTAGVTEFRDPSPEFSIRYYLEANPDVRTAGLDPFLHFVREGRREGRLGRPPGGFRARHLERLRTLEETEHDWRTEVSATPLSDGSLAALFENALRPATKAVLAFSHDNYTSSVGGTQQCLGAEQLAFEEKGFVYLNFHPAQPLPSLAPASSAIVLLLNILVNGKSAGVAHSGDIATAIRRFRDRVDFSLVVHALHGNAPEAVARIAQAAGVRQAFFWVHDFIAVCPGFTLLRNGVHFCGNPPADSPACTVCVFGERRRAHVARISAMFDCLPFTVVAPSATALDLWKRRSTLQLAGELIHPHCTLTVDATPRDITEEPRVVRVAFAGFRTMQKGWPVFETLARRLGHDQRYQFHYFGMEDDGNPNIQFTPVAVSANNRSAMAEVIREKAIDYVVLWAIGPETFSFTTMESLAGGARVLTFRDSGNIARIIADNGQGHVFQAETDLFRFFENGDAVKEASGARPPFGSLQFTSLTADLVGVVDAG